MTQAKSAAVSPCVRFDRGLSAAVSGGMQRWDFVGETENGTDDIWWIDEGQDYPRLWWERGE